MARKWNLVSLTQTEIDCYSSLCPAGEYRVINSAEGLPGISPALLEKCSSEVLLTASGGPDGTVYYVANLLRPDSEDQNGNAIDQQPFGFVVNGKNPCNSGILSQHGTWQGRSIYPTCEQWDAVKSGCIATITLLKIFPPGPSGSIESLIGTSSQGSFESAVRQLGKYVRDLEVEIRSDSV